MIFDAEDRPESDQLKKVVLAFSQAADNVACIQAKLNYYNPRVNFLTPSFALEYTAWFDLVSPGSQRLRGPIPRGGSWYHCRAAVRRGLCCWDPSALSEL